MGEQGFTPLSPQYRDDVLFSLTMSLVMLINVVVRSCFDDCSRRLLNVKKLSFQVETFSFF